MYRNAVTQSASPNSPAAVTEVTPRFHYGEGADCKTNHIFF